MQLARTKGRTVQTALDFYDGLGENSAAFRVTHGKADDRGQCSSTLQLQKRGELGKALDLKGDDLDKALLPYRDALKVKMASEMAVAAANPLVTGTKFVVGKPSKKGRKKYTFVIEEINPKLRENGMSFAEVADFYNRNGSTNKGRPWTEADIAEMVLRQHRVEASNMDIDATATKVDNAVDGSKADQSKAAATA